MDDTKVIDRSNTTGNLATVGQLINLTIRTFKAKLKLLALFSGVLTAIQLLPALPAYWLVPQINRTYTFGEWLEDLHRLMAGNPAIHTTFQSHQAEAFFHNPTPIVELIAYALLAGVVLFFGSIVAQIALMQLISETFLSLSQAFRKSLGKIWWYILTMLLVGLSIFAGFIILIVPAVIFLVWFNTTDWVYVLEGKKGWSALMQSKSYVVGRWWATFGRQLVSIILMFIITVIVNGVAGLLLGGIPILGGIALTYAGILVGTLATIYDFHLYTSLRQTVAILEAK